MRTTLNPVLLILAALAGLLGVPAAAQAQMIAYPPPDNHLTLSGGGVTVTDNYSDYYGNFFPQGGAVGGSFGISGRLNPRPGLIIDADYNHDQATLQDLALTRQQLEIGVGYRGPIGIWSSWYVEGVYAHVEFDGNSPSICGGPCPTEQHDGVGVKAGFLWPFGEQWYGSLGGGYLSMAAHDGFAGLAVPLFNAALGYNLNAHLSLGARIDYAGYIDRNYTGFEQDFTSWRAFVSYHF